MYSVEGLSLGLPNWLWVQVVVVAVLVVLTDFGTRQIVPDEEEIE